MKVINKSGLFLVNGGRSNIKNDKDKLTTILSALPIRTSQPSLLAYVSVKPANPCTNPSI